MSNITENNMSLDNASHNIIKKIENDKIDFVSMWFTDIFGELHSIGIPAYSLNAEYFKEGLDKLDASSVRGFSAINKSDLLLLPDISTYKILPPYYDNENRRNARMFVDIYDGNVQSTARYGRDSRGILKKTKNEMIEFGFTEARFGPEIEFFIFDSIKLFPSSIGAIQPYGGAGYHIESKEAPWADKHVGTVVDLKDGYYTAQPIDTTSSLRKDICDDLHKYFGMRVEAEHHEVATGGQCELNIQHDEMAAMADNVIAIKNLVKVKAASKDKIATFMPKPIYGDNASAMHIHQSLWHGDRNMMYDQDDKNGLSQIGRYYIGGILSHAASLCAISNPTTNSYKRLIPNFEAPVNVCWGINNRSVAIRVPTSHNSEKSKRIEYRIPDATANIYLLEAGLLLAGLDGIKKKIEPGDPVEENVYKLSDEQKRNYGVTSLPLTLKDAIDALQCDSGFLQATFTKDFLDAYCSIKQKEFSAFAQIPTAWEVAMYANV